MSSTLEELIKIRVEKLDKIKQLGVNPYPARCIRKQTCAEALKMMDKEVAVAGRILAIRGHGGIQFFDLRDESGKIQIVFKSDKLAPNTQSLITLLDLGDFIDVQGTVFKTQAGEVSVLASDFHLLTKSIRPLPSQWYGLKDVEERYRKRYLDMLMNPQALDVLVKRSKITYTIRKFLVEKKGYLEVENPVLQSLYGGGRARPFITHHNTLDMDLYLRISNELYLKRLIVGGLEKVFEMGHTFRNEGMDKNHNPEFTMLETMEAYIDYKENMNLIEEMFEFVAKEVFGSTELPYQGKVINYKTPWKRVRVDELFKEHIGAGLGDFDTLEKARALAEKSGVDIKNFMTQGEVLLEIFEKKCTSQIIQPTFVHDYPADFYPLAKKMENNPDFVESFDIYVSGMEMGTNWSEQNDPAELRKEWQKESKKEAEGNEETQKMDEEFLEALDYGMPPTSGIGPGIDRWVMVMTNSPSIADVILFPTLRPDKEIKPEVPKKSETPKPQNIEKEGTGEEKMITREEAIKFLNENVENKNIIKHMMATEAMMRVLAKRLNGNEEEWAIAGLLHDGDYNPNVPVEQQGIKVTEMLREKGFEVPENVAHAMAAHNRENTGVEPESLMDWSLFCGDSLTGLIVAGTLVLPSKKLADLTVESVLKRYKEPSFAKGTRRDEIAMCSDKLGISLEEFVGTVLEAMQGIGSEIGL